MKVLADVIVLPQANARWVLYNVFSRTSLGVEATALSYLEHLTADPETARHEFADQRFQIFEISTFSNGDGLLADPTRLVRPATDWPAGEDVDRAGLEAALEHACVITEDESAYRERFGPKDSMLDRQHFGNFHQQMGVHLMLERREKPDQWWLNQKFNADLTSIQDNLYGAVQDHFLRHYISKRFAKGDNIVDLGCGVGYFTNLIAATGASVLGLEPNEDFIKTARDNFPDGPRFEIAGIGAEGGLDDLPDSAFDYVFMSDALLFYFVPCDPNIPADIEILQRDLIRILKPGGCFVSIEPSYLFWLAPWFGAEDRPFTVLSEYLNKTYAVTPPLSQYLQSFLKAGFMISAFEDALPEESGDVDNRGIGFAREFPLWHLVEFRAPEGAGR